ncbi:MAG: ribosome biogenesis factor YjgA [Steroidobacteraceae bacterium]
MRSRADLDHPAPGDERPSRSAAKRAALDAQRIGVALIDLTATELAQLPLGEELREAVLAAQQLRSRGALARQRQLIGRLMRQADIEALRSAILQRDAERAGAARQAHEAYRWRQRLLGGGDTALAEFAAIFGASAKADLAPIIAAARHGPVSHRREAERRLERALGRAIASRAAGTLR